MTRMRPSTGSGAGRNAREHLLNTRTWPTLPPMQTRRLARRRRLSVVVRQCEYRLHESRETPGGRGHRHWRRIHRCGWRRRDWTKTTTEPATPSSAVQLAMTASARRRAGRGKPLSNYWQRSRSTPRGLPTTGIPGRRTTERAWWPRSMPPTPRCAIIWCAAVLGHQRAARGAGPALSPSLRDLCAGAPGKGRTTGPPPLCHRCTRGDDTLTPAARLLVEHLGAAGRVERPVLE